MSMQMLEPLLVMVVALLLVSAVEVWLLGGNDGEARRGDICHRLLTWLTLALALVSFAILISGKASP